MEHVPSHPDSSTTRESAIPFPFRMGYYLVEPPISFMYPNEPPYSGINRLAFIPGYEQPPLHTGRTRETLFHLGSVVAHLDNTPHFHADRARVDSLRLTYAALGVQFDVIYFTVAYIPRHLDAFAQPASRKEGLADLFKHWYATHLQVPDVPADAQFLGYDVSSPLPTFHSYLIHSPDIRNAARPHLNAHGLLANLADAIPLVDMANAIDYGPWICCAEAVWSIPSDTKRWEFVRDVWAPER